MKPASRDEVDRLLNEINDWMRNHRAFDNNSTLIQIAIAEFVLNQKNYSLFSSGVAQLVRANGCKK